MKLSARNQLKGKITEIQEGAVNAIVKINVGNGNILTADITMQSVKELNLTVGKEVIAVIKATNVMVGIE
ncbi:MAG: TOBE domain-containing protein [Veillonella sp.]|mgnify:FL=1|uniref:TOBE domain-containing protein n=1 Tax=Veillonella atypica TaxID=39777 RepID=UPI0029060311|nr:TOBE domain-containing protein [Veillonella sp.]